MKQGTWGIVASFSNHSSVERKRFMSCFFLRQGASLHCFVRFITVGSSCLKVNEKGFGSEAPEALHSALRSNGYFIRTRQSIFTISSFWLTKQTVLHHASLAVLHELGFKHLSDPHSTSAPMSATKCRVESKSPRTSTQIMQAYDKPSETAQQQSL